MKKTIALLLPVLLCTGVCAQNLNPTVNITNTYLSKAGEGSKYVPERVLPDSLTKFDYKFDYSVFDTPYKGAFEFSPYAVSFNPEPASVDGRQLFIRAGAGYPLYPQLQAVWAPVKGDKFNMNLHQDFNGFLGQYRVVRRNMSSSPMLTTKGCFYDGYDFSELFGADGRFCLGAVNGGFSADYNGIFTKDEAGVHNFHSALAKVNAGSEGWDLMSLKGTLAVDFATDRVPHPYGARNVNEGGFDLDVNAARDLNEKYFAVVDLKFKYVSYSGAEAFAPTYFGFAFTPHVRFQAGPVNLDAGIRLDGAGKLMVAPAVKASLKLFNDALTVYASATGGTKFNTFSEFVRTSHWFSPMYSESMKNSFERINARLGLRGSLFSKLQYDLCTGWASEMDMALWGVNNVSETLKPCLGFRNVNYAFADLLLAWKSDRIDADGSLHFRKSQLDGNADVFDLPGISGNFRAMYNWNKRIYGGARVVFATSRKAKLSGVPMELQPYLDLGVFGEYRLNSRISFWLQGANLLNEAIQTTPMHVESGINFTAGICLSL